MAVTGLTAGPIPFVSIIIVSYNSREYIERCLDSVQKILYPRFEVIVVDNASTDGSAEVIRRKYSFVKLVCLPKNIGFAAANNLGFRMSKGDFIFLLNPDTEVDPMCLRWLVDAMLRDQEIGVCGAKILLLDKRNIIQHAGGKYHPIGISIDRGVLEVDKGQYDKVEEVTFVCGAAVLIRKKLIREVGLFDPSFFLYHEDVDFCIRTWLHGFKVVFVPKAVVYHKQGTSVVEAFAKRPRQPIVVFHKHKNTLSILLKNFPAFTILLWLPFSLCYRMFWLTRYLVNGDSVSVLALTKSVLWIINNARYILSARRNVMRIKSHCHLEKQLSSLKEAWFAYKKVRNFA